MGFVPIRLPDYVRSFLKSNPGETAEEVTKRLVSALKAHQAGDRCQCGEPIWVISIGAHIRSTGIYERSLHLCRNHPGTIVELLRRYRLWAGGTTAERDSHAASLRRVEALLVAQRDGRVHARGALGGNVTCQHGDQDPCQCGAREGNRIERIHAV
jgi:hypothetical protein